MTVIKHIQQQMASKSRRSLSAFLRGTKLELQDAIKNGRNVTIVSGNQSADLDSMSSSILYAYFRTHRPPDKAFTKTYIPILNIPAADVDIRPEFKLIFSQTGIKSTDIATLDDLPKATELKNNLPVEHTRWILVDHNKLEGDLGEIFGKQVHGVIDHHVEENSVPKDTTPEPRILKTSGSCTSLVINHFAKDWKALDQDIDENQQLAKLAMASILIDTKNMADKSKATSHDLKASQTCKEIIQVDEESWDQQKFYDDLDEAKKDIEPLSLQGIFRKDYKQWTEAGSALGISSVVKSLQFLGDKAQKEAPANTTEGSDAWMQEVSRFMADRGIGLHAVMTTSMQDGEFTREICFQWSGPECEETVKRFETMSKDQLGLEEKRIDGINDVYCKVWIQNQVENSRKQVAPLMRKAMRGESRI